MKALVSSEIFSVLELARDKGWIGQALSTIPEWVLKAADKWARQDADYQQGHGDPNRLPLPDPWQFLLDAPAVGDLGKRTCRSAQSQLVALRHLCRMATGVATSETDWQQQALEARASGDKGLSDHAATKVASALWRFEAAQTMPQEFGMDDPTRVACAEAWQSHRRAQHVHRSDWDEAKGVRPLPRWDEIQKKFPIQTRLVFGWVRLRIDGPPGLMFWRNQALTKLVLALGGKHLSLKNLGQDYIKNLRQNLGLIPVNDAACLIWHVDLSALSEGGWRFRGYERNDALIFDEIFPAWNVR